MSEILQPIIVFRSAMRVYGIMPVQRSKNDVCEVSSYESCVIYAYGSLRAARHRR